jgi:hypothetical protein
VEDILGGQRSQAAAAVQAVLVAGAAEPPHEGLKREEQDRVASLDGLDPEGDREVDFPDSRRNSRIVRSLHARSPFTIAGTPHAC